MPVAATLHADNERDLNSMVIMKWYITSLMVPGESRHASRMPWRFLTAVVAMLSFTVLLSTGCSNQQSTNAPASSDSASTAHAGATITAIPNPVPAGPGKGTTTISWDTGDGSMGVVVFSINNGPENQWFSKTAKGTWEAPWINKGGIYEFRLYSSQERAKPLATVRVTKQ